MSVEVTIEVYAFLDSVKRKSENLTHEKRRHWDRRKFDESIVAREGQCYSETPEQWACRKETLQEIIAVLESCTEIQQQRSFFLLWMGRAMRKLENSAAALNMPFGIP